MANRALVVWTDYFLIDFLLFKFHSDTFSETFGMRKLQFQSRTQHLPSQHFNKSSSYEQQAFWNHIRNSNLFVNMLKCLLKCPNPFVELQQPAEQTTNLFKLYWCYQWTFNNKFVVIAANYVHKIGVNN